METIISIYAVGLLISLVISISHNFNNIDIKEIIGGSIKLTVALTMPISVVIIPMITIKTFQYISIVTA